LSYNRTSTACGWRGYYGQSVAISSPWNRFFHAKRKKAGWRTRPFPVTDRQREEDCRSKPAIWKGGGNPPRRVFTVTTRQATLSSFTDWSKALLSGRDISSTTLVDAVWNSFACSTALSTDLRRNEV